MSTDAAAEALVAAREKCRAKKFVEAVAVIDGALASPSLSTEARLHLLYLKGTCYGNLGQHEDALKHGARMLEDHPRAAEGYYLMGMALNASGRLDEATEYFREAQKIDKQNRGEASNATVEKIANLVRTTRAEQYRNAMKAHAAAYQTYVGAKCQKCCTKFAHPTPQWYCSKCFPGSLELIWEPDDERGSCHVCGEKCGLGSRHHCRCCGHLVCSTHSKKEVALPLLNFPKPVRVCDRCFETRESRKVQQQQRQQQQQEQGRPLRPASPSGQESAAKASAAHDSYDESQSREDATGSTDEVHIDEPNFSESYPNIHGGTSSVMRPDRSESIAPVAPPPSAARFSSDSPNSAVEHDEVLAAERSTSTTIHPDVPPPSAVHFDSGN